MARDEALRDELLRLATHAADPSSADRLWEILDDYEIWPGIRLVGIDGEDAAWRVAQLGDAGLQRRCLEHLEAAVDCGDANPAHYACLVDRIRMSDGKPQVYGSQFVVGDGNSVAPWPIEDPLRVDERRQCMNLPPLAQQRRRMQEQFDDRGHPHGMEPRYARRSIP
jgi:hypothetical protein